VLGGGFSLCLGDNIVIFSMVKQAHLLLSNNILGFPHICLMVHLLLKYSIRGHRLHVEVNTSRIYQNIINNKIYRLCTSMVYEYAEHHAYRIGQDVGRD
jgi:hypothetical protein